jgi:hypothetical protein
LPGQKSAASQTTGRSFDGGSRGCGTYK